MSNLRQIGMALHQYHDEHNALPIGWQWENTRSSAYGWGVSILPYLEQRDIYRIIDRNDVLQSAANSEARRSYEPLFFCPSDISTPTFTLYDEFLVSSGSTAIIELPTANYVGVFGTSEADDGIPAPPGEGAFVESRSTRFDDFEHGQSSTLLVGERTMARVPSTWLGVDIRGADAACRLVGNAGTAPNCRACDECEFDSRHDGGAMFLWGDGHVCLVSDSIDTAEYRHSARLAGP
jgi:prepilin-type processing-associated H-X9-DG protein